MHRFGIALQIYRLIRLTILYAEHGRLTPRERRVPRLEKEEIARGIGCTQGLALVNTRGVVVGGIVGYFSVPIIGLGVNVAVVGAFAGGV